MQHRVGCGFPIAPLPLVGGPLNSWRYVTHAVAAFSLGPPRKRDRRLLTFVLNWQAGLKKEMRRSKSLSILPRNKKRLIAAAVLAVLLPATAAAQEPEVPAPRAEDGAGAGAGAAPARLARREQHVRLVAVDPPVELR